MSLQTSLVTVLTSLVSGRVYPRTAPPLPTFPLIIYQGVGGQSIAFLEGGTAPSKKNARVQIIAWVATTAIAAETLAEQIDAAMRAATAFNAEPLGEAEDLFEEDLNLYGSRQDFSVWINR